MISNKCSPINSIEKKNPVVQTWTVGSDREIRCGAMAIRALRGAITIDHDTSAEVKQRTIEMLEVLFERNELQVEDIISIFFTTTSDIRSVPPAAAARDFGLVDVPLLCAQEMESEVGVARCIRLMLHLNTDRERAELRHVFLRGATALRPELAEPGDRERP